VSGAIRYLKYSAGGFLAGDSEVAAYAYPTSQHAVAARRRPAQVARAMLKGQAQALASAVAAGVQGVAERNARWLSELDQDGTLI
jgi:hypothetical protein